MTIWFELDLKLLELLCPLGGHFPSWKAFRFCFGALGDGEGAQVLQEGCEFAEELLHKENVPTLSPGWRRFPDWAGISFFTLYLLPKQRLHSYSWFFITDWLVYLCRIIIFVIVIWPQIQTALNVKCCLLMCCSMSCLWPHTGPSVCPCSAAFNQRVTRTPSHYSTRRPARVCVYIRKPTCTHSSVN